MPQQKPISGFPGLGAAPDFQSAELVSLAGLGETAISHDNLLELLVPSDLPNRKIYGYIWGLASDTTDWMAYCAVKFWQGGTPLSELPVTIGLSKSAGTKVPRSGALVFINGGSPVADSFGLQLSSPTGGQPNGVVLQAFNIHATCDRITFGLKQGINLTDLRVYIACLSQP